MNPTAEAQCCKCGNVRKMTMLSQLAERRADMVNGTPSLYKQVMFLIAPSHVVPVWFAAFTGKNKRVWDLFSMTRT